jgi:excisionase family DNA binding protein
MTVSEAAEALGIGRSAAYGLIKRGELAAIKLGRRTLIPTHQLWLLLGMVDEHVEPEPNSEPRPPTTRARWCPDCGHQHRCSGP